MHTKSPHGLIVGGLRQTCLFLASLTFSFAAPVKFEIPAQSAPPAIMAFSKQARVEVVYSADDLKDIRANEVVGEFEPTAALVQLLSGTGFTGRMNSTGKFVITIAAADKPGSIDGQVRDEAGRPVFGAKVTLADSDKIVLTDKRGRFSFTGVVAGAHSLQITADGLQNTRVTDVAVKSGQQHSLSPITIPVKKEGTLQLEDFVVSAKKNDGVVELDPYEVSGQKAKPFSTANVDIPRTINDVQPYTIFDSKLIEKSGATNVEDFLRNQLTANGQVQPTSQVNGLLNPTPLGNSSSINLRGLGSDKTLILVNGRRVAAPTFQVGGTPTSTSQADLNGIALGSIERIEVLSTSASGIYGASALGGVINIILKKNYTGGEIRLTYDNTFDSDAARRSVDLLYGMGLNDGKTRFRVSGSWSDSSALRVGDRRAILERGLAVILRNNPTFLYSSSFSNVLGAQPNIFATSAAQTTLTLKDGSILPFPNTSIPAGTSPTTPQAALYAGLLANAGKLNYDLPNTAQYPTGLRRQTATEPITKSAAVNLEQDLGERVTLTVDASRSENSAITNYGLSSGQFSISAANPISPFTTSVSVIAPITATAPWLTESQSDMVTVGLIAKLPYDWIGQADYSWSRSIGRQSQPSINISYFFDLPAGLINPFVDTQLFPIELAKYYHVATSEYETTIDDYAFRGSGPLMALPTGMPYLTIGIERRVSEMQKGWFDDSYVENGSRNGFITRLFPLQQQTDSVYAEATVPLVKQKWVPFIHALELQVSGRAERFTVDTGTPRSLTNTANGAVFYGSPTLNGLPFTAQARYTSSNSTLGLKYQPTPDVILRASVGTAFIPPTPDQLLANPLPDVNPATIVDARTGATVSVQTTSGGNPSLRPQNSRSFNAGVVWQPTNPKLQGLRFNVEYYRIQQMDFIGFLSAQQLVDNESIFPDRVIRSAAGQITQVNASFVNLFSRDTAGWDISASYTFNSRLGEFRFDASESIIAHLKQQISLTLPNYDYANFPNEGGAAKYRTVGTLSWNRKQWSAGWTARYTGAYRQSGALDSPSRLQTPSSVLGARIISAQGSEVIPSQIYHDLTVGYDFGGLRTHVSENSGKITKLVKGTAIRVGVRNVFNTYPPLDVRYSFFASPYGDIRLRSYWITLKREF